MYIQTMLCVKINNLSPCFLSLFTFHYTMLHNKLVIDTHIKAHIVEFSIPADKQYVASPNYTVLKAPIDR